MLVKFTRHDNLAVAVRASDAVCLKEMSRDGCCRIYLRTGQEVGVLGTLDEVAAKLNGVSSRHFEKALAMAIDYEQRKAEAPCKS